MGGGHTRSYPGGSATGITIFFDVAHEEGTKTFTRSNTSAKYPHNGSAPYSPTPISFFGGFPPRTSGRFACEVTDLSFVPSCQVQLLATFPPIISFRQLAEKYPLPSHSHIMNIHGADEVAMSCMGSRRLRSADNLWQINSQGLVRRPRSLSERHDEGNTSPSWRALYFLCCSLLLVHVRTYGSDTNTHPGGSLLRQICTIAPSRFWVKASATVTSLSGGSEMSHYGADASLRQ